MKLQAFKGVIIVEKIETINEPDHGLLQHKTVEQTLIGKVVSAGETEQDVKIGDIVCFMGQRGIEIDKSNKNILAIQENALLFKQLK